MGGIRSSSPFASYCLSSFLSSLSYRVSHRVSRYDIPGLPVEVTMEAQTPCVPLNTQDSSLPAAYFTFTFTNHSAAPVPVSLMEVQVRIYVKHHSHSV